MTSKELEELERLGELEVLRQMAAGLHGQVDSPLRNEVEAWLRVKRLERDASNDRSADLIAREALQIAKKQKTIAIIQIVISTITAIVVAFIGVFLTKS